MVSVADNTQHDIKAHHRTRHHKARRHRALCHRKRLLARWLLFLWSIRRGLRGLTKNTSEGSITGPNLVLSPQLGLASQPPWRNLSKIST
jgi:hypothetical protein